ncbi:unnamed protein product [Parnassius mnemosyne]|uniref:Endonuclease/exonuclease/phosphatase domain-containing protein n=1 Tax=Parnassius mnemosyne TaxID=213953 RepID=A0AAV1MBM1_9NEOP
MTETWLNRSVFDSEIFDDRYNVYRRDRESNGFHASKNDGGVLIAVPKQINSERLFSFESKCEDLWVCVEVENVQGKSERLYIFAVYIPPPVEKHIFEHFINNSSRVLESLDENIIVAGDFNLSSITWSLEPHGHLCAKYSNKYLQNLLTDFLSCNELNQLNQIKNSKNKMLDLVLSNINIVDIVSCPDPLTCVDPLHPPLVLSIDFTDPAPLVPNNTITKFCFHKADYENIRKDLNEIDWREILAECLCVDDMVAVFMT